MTAFVIGGSFGSRKMLSAMVAMLGFDCCISDMQNGVSRFLCSSSSRRGGGIRFVQDAGTFNMCGVNLQALIYVDCLIIKGVCCSLSGHGMIVEGNLDHEHWGRRLMASVPDNESEPKNCSAPGILLWHQSCTDQLCCLYWQTNRVITERCDFPQLCGFHIFFLSCPQLNIQVSHRAK